MTGKSVTTLVSGKVDRPNKTVISRVISFLYTIGAATKLLGLGICVISLFSFSQGQDLLEKAFFPAKTHETIVNLGDDKNAVGNEFLRQGTNVDAGVNQCIKDGRILRLPGGVADRQVECEAQGGTFRIIAATAQPQAPLIVRITKFLLRITIVLAVTMVIYNGIRYILTMGKDDEVKKTRNNLIYLAVGLLLALLSVAIINLLNSVTISSIDIGDTNQVQKENLVNEGLGFGCFREDDSRITNHELDRQMCADRGYDWSVGVFESVASAVRGGQGCYKEDNSVVTFSNAARERKCGELGFDRGESVFNTN